MKQFTVPVHWSTNAEFVVRAKDEEEAVSLAYKKAFEVACVGVNSTLDILFDAFYEPEYMPDSFEVYAEGVEES